MVVTASEFDRSATVVEVVEEAAALLWVLVESFEDEHPLIMALAETARTVASRSRRVRI